jgi:hypothetical protein
LALSIEALSIEFDGIGIRGIVHLAPSQSKHRSSVIIIRFKQKIIDSAGFVMLHAPMRIKISVTPDVNWIQKCGSKFD